MDGRTLLAVCFLGALLAPALVAESQTQIAAEADLVQLDSAGQPIQSFMQYHLALNEAGDRAVSLSLSEGPHCVPPMMCPMFASRLRQFKILRQVRDACGSVRYFSLEVTSRSRLLLVDHTNRICDDFHPYTWIVSLSDPGQTTQKLYGNPKPRDPQPQCADIQSGAVCPMIYAPTTCQASSVGGATLPTPVSAKGSNACFAKLNLETALCEQGLDWQKMDDLSCAPDPIHVCQIPDCAAPPAGCTYQSDPSQVDANGCPLGCGRLVCAVRDPLPPPAP